MWPALLLLAVCAPEKAAPPCVRGAQTLVARLEKMPEHRRHAAIEMALRRDPAVMCGVADAKFFGQPVAPPQGCTDLAHCKFSQGIAVEPAVAGAVSLELYVRVQTLATRLRAAGRLTDAHQKLLAMWLRGAAIAPQSGRD